MMYHVTVIKMKGGEASDVACIFLSDEATIKSTGFGEGSTKDHILISKDSSSGVTHTIKVPNEVMLF